ncbi:hypothetical protein BRE01_33630 [Brevibacillus reuszeri]|uniref:Uncharacterized protein n=1 Tax=Brevibacillus reuszeri TaxID=54915 RepID=A0A0K9YZ48_9BACL|nr:hypothetical protein [Brevibacillus reuszeri]KNB73525.1 hypothetical protein ADS79_06150 [Brevibacillus reuszeri]MED1858681.1 hypothetical protein [Brevibacillus reuszeri]GED69661.1 hypothetical protein BRE01_33630 [Brevibacillus reuszeri]
MIRKIVVALLTAIIFCLGLAWLNYTPLDEQQANTYSWSFASLVMVYLIYAAPVYVLGGVPLALLIEYITEKIGWVNPVVNYVFRLIAYGLAGLVVMMLFGLIMSGGKSIQSTLLSDGWIRLGVVASLLYLHVWLLSFVIVKPKRGDWSHGQYLRNL